MSSGIAKAGNMISAFLRFYFSPSLANWRSLRRLCMARLPQKPKKEPTP